jgi:hypothetical protein
MGDREARALWSTVDPAPWRAALDAYPEVIVRQGARDLARLDGWYRADLPEAIQRRTPPFLEPDELVDAVRWKMVRGEWRPRNLALVRGNHSATVRATSQRAFALAPDPRKPLAALSELAGVGPATASAVLAAYRPDLYPFLDDVVAAAVPELEEPRFTLAYYVRYAEALHQRAEELGPGWTSHSVGLALWSASGGKRAAAR